MKKFISLLVFFLSICFVSSVLANATNRFTICNHTGAAAFDLHLVFNNGGNQLTSTIVQTPAAGQNYGWTTNSASASVNIIWVAGSNVPNGQCVKIDVTTNGASLTLDSGYWTDASHNPQGSSFTNPDDVILVASAGSNCFPPSGCQYACANPFYQYGSVALSNVTFQIGSCQTPPASGTQTQTFTGSAQGNSSFSGPFSCPISGSMALTFVDSQNTSYFYNTQMLSLNLSGGTLPSGIMVRANTTQSSVGQTIIRRDSTGQFHISSFFDIFTELSTDGGNTWIPSAANPSHSVLQPNASSIPALSHWGLIALSVLVLAMGIFFVRRAMA
jgi:hypothetical protein